MKNPAAAPPVQFRSLWTATARMPVYPPLTASIRADVCVVGAGIAGLTTAYMLAKAGRSVVVLDDGPLASGMTAVTTAHLTNALDDRYFEIERLHGDQGLRLTADSHSAAIDQIETIVREESIDCDFRRVDGYLILAPEHEESLIDKELEAAHHAGIPEVEKLARAPIAAFNTGPCLRFPNQGQFHPLKYLAAVATAIDRLGGRLYARTHADSIEGGERARVTVGAHKVAADAIVVATNVPINDRVAIHTKQAPYMTYVVGMRVERGSIDPFLLWDTGDPYHYVRVQDVNAEDSWNGAGEHEVLIVGGEDHKSGQATDTQERHARLERWTRERFPMATELEFKWAGQVMETIDGLAFIGRNPADDDNVYVCTGDSGMGMTHGTIAGMLISDLIMGRENPWESLYDPSRKTLKAAGDFARENLNVAAQFADYVTGGDVGSAEDIAPGTGALIRRGLKKVAAYRDVQGVLHERSAVCPHLGCIVQWNASEETWDCPCHGSRFHKFGKVFNGPANRDLSEVDD